MCLRTRRGVNMPCGTTTVLKVVGQLCVDRILEVLLARTLPRLRPEQICIAELAQRLGVGVARHDHLRTAGGQARKVAVWEQCVPQTVAHTAIHTRTRTNNTDGRTCAFRGRHAHAYYIGRTCGAAGGRREGVLQLLADGPHHGAVCSTPCGSLRARAAGVNSSAAGRDRCSLGYSRRRAATGGHARSTRDAGGGARLLVPFQGVMEGPHSVGVA